MATAFRPTPSNTRLLHLAVAPCGGKTFEFVHDQMHFYLAARWFAEDGFSVSELESMIAGSSIWTHTPDARETLWGFRRLAELWDRVQDHEEWDSLRRALKAEARHRGIKQPLAAQYS